MSTLTLRSVSALAPPPPPDDGERERRDESVEGEAGEGPHLPCSLSSPSLCSHV